MRVLIAHANEAARAKLADVVTRGRRVPLDILESGDAPEVLEMLLSDDPPEVALIDWDLPGVEAPEMCRLIRDFHHHHDTWIIVLASSEHQESASEAWKAGADDCVHTPAPPRLLSDRVTKGLCEMSPAMQGAAAAQSGVRAAVAQAAQAAQAAVQAAAARPAVSALVATADPDGDSVVEPFHAARPSLDAVRRCDDEVAEDEEASLTADLKATVDEEDDAHERPAELAAGPVLLSAHRVDADQVDEEDRGPATLDAVLVRL